MAFILKIILMKRFSVVPYSVPAGLQTNLSKTHLMFVQMSPPSGL